MNLDRAKWLVVCFFLSVLFTYHATVYTISNDCHVYQTLASNRTKLVRQGWIVDIDFLLDTLPESGRPPHMETAFLNEENPDFEHVYRTLTTKHVNNNPGVQHQHLSQVLMATCLHRHFRFRIVTNKSDLARIQRDDQVMLFWGHTEHWSIDSTKHRNETSRITFEQMQNHLIEKFGHAVGHFLEEWPSWIDPANGGANLIYVGSFPRGFPIRPISNWKYLSRATFVVTEYGMLPREMRLKEMAKIHIIPYSLWQTSDGSEQAQSTDEAAPTGTVVSATENRPIFVFMRAGCRIPGSYGMYLRHELVEIFSSVEETVVNTFPGSVDVQCCSSGHEEARRDGHTGYVQRIRAARFCLIAPGDTMSSLRLIEVLAHSCVPVLVGPPFHTVPLTSIWDWSNLAVFVYVHNQSWVSLRESADRSIFSEAWFLPSSWVESIETLEELPTLLLKVNKERYAKLKENVAVKQKEFSTLSFNHTLNAPIYIHNLASRIISDFHQTYQETA